MSEPTAAEWAWIAGLFEGEGSIVFGRGHAACAKVIMTDRDVIETLERLVPASGITTVIRDATRKDAYQWTLAPRDRLAAFLRGVEPWMHGRRGARITETLERLSKNHGLPKDRTHCIHGHALAGDNLYTYASGKRACKACRARSQRAWRKRNS